ncbi:MAG TPA: DUF4386 domain-containing protein [Gemmatimonadales bacterium]|nr:DUF4386 domain-containing protein [Gemmatimonadales bacterium]
MTSLSKHARIAGLLYVVASAVGVVRLMYVPKALIVSGNASVTAANIAAHESLFRIGIVCNLLGAVLWLFVPLALYRLLRGVDQTLAALMVLLGSVMQVPLFFVNTASDMATLLFARGGDLVAAFNQPQRDAFVRVFLELHHSIELANAIFWGLWLIPFGMLVYRSRFFPRFLGVWVIAACFGWLAFSLTGFLLPAYEDKAFTYGQPLMIGELVMMLWLVVMGAREPT